MHVSVMSRLTAVSQGLMEFAWLSLPLLVSVMVVFSVV